jgi:hypothetical protein
MPQRQKTMNYALYLMYLFQKFTGILIFRGSGIKESRMGIGFWGSGMGIGDPTF